MRQSPVRDDCDTDLDTQSYEALRSRVQSLKVEKHSVLSHAKSQREAESYALLQQRVDYEQKLQELQGQLSHSQQQLKQHLERATRVRNVLEREKKQLQAQVGKLTAGFEAVAAEHAAQVVSLEGSWQQQLQEAKDGLIVANSQHEEDMASLRAECSLALRDTEEFCHAEMEAVKAVAQQQVAEAHAQVEAWQQRYDEERITHAHTWERCEELGAQVKQLLQKLEEQRNQAGSAVQELEEQQKLLQQERAVAKSKFEATVQTHNEQVNKLKAEHHEQLAIIGARMEGVIKRKDTTITSLRQDLDALTRKVEEFGDLT